MNHLTLAQCHAIYEALCTRSVWTLRDFRAIGLDRTGVRLRERRGKLRRVDFGLYVSLLAEETAARPVVLASVRVPGAVVAMESALWLHRLSDHPPGRVWLALDEQAWLPQVEGVEFVRTSGRGEGIEKQVVEGVPLRVTSPARTVCNLLRHRRRVGAEVGRAALLRLLAERPGDRGLLLAQAGPSRVRGVLEDLLGAA